MNQVTLWPFQWLSAVDNVLWLYLSDLVFTLTKNPI